MRTIKIVILGIVSQHVAQMRHAEDDLVVETLAPGRANQALDMAVLPGRIGLGRVIVARGDTHSWRAVS